MSGHVRYLGAPRRKQAPEPQFVLTEIEVEEISHVNFPANNRPWIVKRAGRPNQEGVIEVETPPARTLAICEKLFVALGAIEAALDGRDELAKRLDVSDQAREMVFDYMGEIHGRLEALCELLYSAPGAPLSGSLDAAIGGELASIGSKFAYLASGFGVTEAPDEAETVRMSETQKAGRAMSRDRLRKLGESLVMLDGLSSILRALFDGAGGDEDIIAAAQDSMGDGLHKSITTDLDEKLATVVTALAESHYSITQGISRLDDRLTKSVSKIESVATEAVAKTFRRPAGTPAVGSNQPSMERPPAPEPATDADRDLDRVYSKALESVD